MVPEKMVSLDQVIASSPVVVLWGEPLEHRPVDFVTSNIGQFGYTVTEMVLEEVPYRSFVYAEDWNRIASGFADALHAGKDTFVSDYRIVTRSGDIRWVEDRVFFHRNPAGKVAFYQSSLLDITERKAAEMRLRESEERLARVLHSASVGVWEFFPERDEIVGPGRAYLFGMKEEQLPVSRKELWDRIIPPSERVALEALWAGIIEGRSEALDFEHEVLRVDGSTGWVLTKGFPARDEGGRLIRMQGVTVDVTHLKRAEESVIRQNQRLALLHDMSLGFMEELDSKLLIHRILERAAELAGSPHGLIASVEEDGSVVRNIWGTGLYEKLVGNVNPVSTGLLGRVLAENRRIIVEDYRVFPERMNLEAYRDVTTVIGIPLHRGEHRLGAISIAFTDTVRTLEESLLTLLDQCAAAASIAFENASLYEASRKGYEKLRQTFSDVIRTMGQVVGKKDPYTIEHQERVAVLSSEIGQKMGLDPERCEGLRIAGLVHDVGKIEIPGEILSKPGRLSPLEFELIKTHPRSGFDILREVDFPWPVAEIAHQHHERMDGSGYPRGLKGEEILPEARILAVADVVESMMSHRPYRPSLGMEAAREEITSGRGRLYDPEVVDVCLSLLEERPDIIAEM